MKRVSKPLLLISVLVILGGLMTVQYMLTRQISPEGSGEQADAPKQPPIPGPKVVAPPPIVQQTKIYLVRTRGGNLSLKQVERGLDAQQAKDQLTSTMTLLCQGAGTGEDLQNPMPSGTKVLGVDVNGGLATVNFSPELERNFPGGSEWEALTISSIVNTLTQFPNVKRVQILIGGKKRETLGGHIDISQPLSRNERFL